MQAKKAAKDAQKAALKASGEEGAAQVAAEEKRKAEFRAKNKDSKLMSANPLLAGRGPLSRHHVFTPLYTPQLHPFFSINIPLLTPPVGHQKHVRFVRPTGLSDQPPPLSLKPLSTHF